MVFEKFKEEEHKKTHKFINRNFEDVYYNIHSLNILNVEFSF